MNHPSITARKPRIQPLLETSPVEQQPVILSTPKMDIETHVRHILAQLGEDTDREGLQRTPYRVAKMYKELLDGYDQNLDTLVNGALFEVRYGDHEMVVVANIEYNSMCEHHMLPFLGKAHVAYIPNNKVIGLSKIPRIVDMFAHRLQIQERMTNEIADGLDSVLETCGVMVMVEGEHSCARLRGVKKHGINMVTFAKRGVFREEHERCNEFYRLIGR